LLGRSKPEEELTMSARARVAFTLPALAAGVVALGPLAAHAEGVSAETFTAKRR